MDTIFDLQTICIAEKANIRNALLALDNCRLGIILVVKNKKLIGTLTDGDIRRALLNGKELNSCIGSIMNRNFYFITEKDNLLEAQEKLIQKRLRHLPVLDEEGFLIKLLVPSDFNKKYLPNIVVIMAGGIGSRLRPQTSNCPKPMLEVNGKPIL